MKIKKRNVSTLHIINEVNLHTLIGLHQMIFQTLYHVNCILLTVERTSVINFVNADVFKRGLLWKYNVYLK